VDLLSRTSFMALTEVAGGPCVTILMPTVRSRPEKRQNSPRFKKLVRRAEELLVAEGLATLKAKALLEPAQSLLENAAMWEDTGDGLAAFISPTLFRYYHLPLRLEELVVVNRLFHVKPLFPLVTYDGEFYVLALSKKQNRLLQCTRETHAEVDVPHMPQGLAEVTQYDVREKQSDFHTRAPRSKGRRMAVVHGHDEGAAVVEERLQEYLHQVSKRLNDYIGERRVPLVLAGVDYIQYLYRKLSSYPGLWGAGVKGNPDRLTAEELHRQAWGIVESHFRKGYGDAIARYRELAGKGRTSGAVEEIVEAASAGRVETLFADAGAQVWGAIDPDSREVRVRAERQAGDEELTNLAAIRAYAAGGEVHAVERAAMPEDTPLAAIFRFRL